VEHGIRGIISPLTTPFDESGSLDEGALPVQCRWLLAVQCRWLLAVASTRSPWRAQPGEGNTLS
jgi:dihydrodipicolinate synthase/N-acetylneuraminate lyase